MCCLLFLNQARAWFLKIDPVRTVGMCVCVCVRACVRACVCVPPRPRLLMTSDVMWCDMDLIRLVKLNKFYSCYMATVVVVVNGHGLGIGTRRH